MFKYVGLQDYDPWNGASSFMWAIFHLGALIDHHPTRRTGSNSWCASLRRLMVRFVFSNGKEFQSGILKTDLGIGGPRTARVVRRRFVRSRRRTAALAHACLAIDLFGWTRKAKAPGLLFPMRF